MKFDYLIKTDCAACLGIVKEVIKKIDDVSDVEIDSTTNKIMIDYEGKSKREELKKIIQEKIGYELI